MFEGAFQLTGTESADAVLTAGSAHWSSSAGKLASTGKVNLSLTSGNAGGSRVIGTLLLTGKRQGNLSLQTQGPSIIAEDTSAAPYTRSIALGTPAGTTLASINVVTDVVGAAAPSMTATWLAVLCGALLLSGFAVLRRVKHA